MKKVGYLRVSTEEQKPDRQIDGLSSYCDILHVERISAAAEKRPVFDRLMSEMKAGEMLVVWDLDRAFRSTLDALSQTQKLKERDVEFKIVSMNIDTSEPFGEFFFTIVAALAQLERQMLSKRTKEGLRAAVKRGQRLGRPPSLSLEQLLIAREKLISKEMILEDVAALYGVHASTVSRSLRRLEQQSSAE